MLYNVWRTTTTTTTNSYRPDSIESVFMTLPSISSSIVSARMQKHVVLSSFILGLLKKKKKSSNKGSKVGDEKADYLLCQYYGKKESFSIQMLEKASINANSVIILQNFETTKGNLKLKLKRLIKYIRRKSNYLHQPVLPSTIMVKVG